MDNKIDPNDFNPKKVHVWLQEAQKQYIANGDLPVEQICCFLQEFCKIFKQMSTLLGIAFSDVNEKVAIMRLRTSEYPNQKGIMDIIQKEKERGVLEMNGDNNKKLSSQPELKNYVSLGRTLLRMMRFMDYLKIMFTEILEKRNIKISEACSTAYMTALYPYHEFLVQTAAKIAMSAAPDRNKILNVFIGLSQTLNQEQAYIDINQFLQAMEPIRVNLWTYYESNQLCSLP